MDLGLTEGLQCAGLGGFTGRAGGGTISGVLGGKRWLVTGEPGGSWVTEMVEGGGGISLGESTGRDKVGLAGSREASSISLASSLSGDAVREMLREEVRILSWLVWASEGAAAVHLAPVGPTWPRQGRQHLVQERGAEDAAGEGSTSCPG